MFIKDKYGNIIYILRIGLFLFLSLNFTIHNPRLSYHLLHHQYGSSGSRRLQGITTNAMPITGGLVLSDPESTFPLEGIDLNQLKYVVASAETSKADHIQDTAKPKLVLMAIRELGNETYYQKRGFRTVWSGTVPVGMWDCRKDCTMVYMEMDLD